MDLQRNNDFEERIISKLKIGLDYILTDWMK